MGEGAAQIDAEWEKKKKKKGERVGFNHKNFYASPSHSRRAAPGIAVHLAVLTEPHGTPRASSQPGPLRSPRDRWGGRSGRGLSQEGALPAPRAPAALAGQQRLPRLPTPLPPRAPRGLPPAPRPPLRQRAAKRPVEADRGGRSRRSPHRAHPCCDRPPRLGGAAPGPADALKPGTAAPSVTLGAWKRQLRAAGGPGQRRCWRCSPVPSRRCRRLSRARAPAAPPRPRRGAPGPARAARCHRPHAVARRG